MSSLLDRSGLDRRVSGTVELCFLLSSLLDRATAAKSLNRRAVVWMLAAGLCASLNLLAYEVTFGILILLPPVAMLYGIRGLTTRHGVAPYGVAFR